MPSKCPGDRKEPSTEQGEREVPSADNSVRARRRVLAARGSQGGGVCARGPQHVAAVALRTRSAGARALDARLLGNRVRLSVGFRESPLPSPRNNRFGGFTF